MKAGTLRLTALLALAWIGGGAASAEDPIKIGVLSDFNGFTSAIAGQGSVVATEMAIEDFGGSVAGRKIEVVYADHQNKPDVGQAVARKWFDVDGVDVIVDVPNSAVALAVQDVAKNVNKVVVQSAAGTPALTGKACTENDVHWARDAYALARSLGKSIVKAGGDTWFFVTADYAFGHAAEAEMTKVVTQSGGKVLGSARHPPSASDFSSFLLTAQASKAKVVALANAGGDTSTSIKQAQEFGLITGGQTVVALTPFITDIHALGLAAAQGIELTDVFYWDDSDSGRAWAQRFFAKHGAMPTSVQADAYSAITHYLKAIAAGADPKDGKAVVAKMKATPVSDALLPKGYIREDGKLVRDMYIYRVKTPAESKGEWDLYKKVSTIPGEELVRPLADSDCPLVKK